jgi:hypothetical protein
MREWGNTLIARDETATRVLAGASGSRSVGDGRSGTTGEAAGVGPPWTGIAGVADGAQRTGSGAGGEITKQVLRQLSASRRSTAAAELGVRGSGGLRTLMASHRNRERVLDALRQFLDGAWSRTSAARVRVVLGRSRIGRTARRRRGCGSGGAFLRRGTTPRPRQMLSALAAVGPRRRTWRPGPGHARDGAVAGGQVEGGGAPARREESRRRNPARLTSGGGRLGRKGNLDRAEPCWPGTARWRHWR